MSFRYTILPLIIFVKCDKGETNDLQGNHFLTSSISPASSVGKSICYLFIAESPPVLFRDSSAVFILRGAIPWFFAKK